MGEQIQQFLEVLAGDDRIGGSRTVGHRTGAVIDLAGGEYEG